MQAISSNELREKYQQFFEAKGHVRIPSAPLVPENDPSVLFTTAGMHPLVPCLKGQPHPQGKLLTDVQKCLRTTDISAVGDDTHATVFEMLGNWSLGDYFKEEAIAWSWEFLTTPQGLDINPEYLAVSVFSGDNAAPRDTESAKIWQKVGLPTQRLAYLGKKDNWWPAGQSPLGPQGPDTEMFYWVGTARPPKRFDPRDNNWVEIWNNVFMEYDGQANGALKQLVQKNVDTGMGLERTVMVLNGLQSIYEIDTYRNLMSLIEKHANKHDERQKRILADHIKAMAFILGDEHRVSPSNKDQGYVLRRIIRRAALAMRELSVQTNVSAVMSEGMKLVVEEYKDAYPSLPKQKDKAAAEIRSEVGKFDIRIDKGMRELDKIVNAGKKSGDLISGDEAFLLWESFGFPVELTTEVAEKFGLKVDQKGFESKLKKHQEKSRVGAAGKFVGGLADRSEQSTKYHTATHLLHQALREVLGDHVLQRGSNITAERLRFDFSHPEKMTAGELEQVEKIVNDKITQNLPVTREEMSVQAAKDQGALGLFEHKYDDKVSVYAVGNYSMEICGGPHVKRTGELGTFKIKKEESSSVGIRRIKAVLTA